jgi:hypothetical protein
VYQPLVPCPACDRHVRTTHAVCPFCDTPLPADLGGRAAPAATARLGRAAAFAFGASIALTGCGSDVVMNASGGSTSGGGASATGGAGGGGGSATGGGGASTGGSGGATTTSTSSSGIASSGALYGAPPPPPHDAGVPDSGGFGSDYGAPPPPPKGDAGPPH